MPPKPRVSPPVWLSLLTFFQLVCWPNPRGDESLGIYRQFSFLCAAFASLVASPAAAHPHVWATVRSEIILNADHQITAVRHAWTFDEFYSAMAVQGLDTNGDGVFSVEELKPLAEVNIKSLKDFDYFTFVHIGDGDNLPLKPPENYSLDYDKGLLTLHFTLPLEKPLDAHGQEVQVDVYDPSFFVAFGFATEAPVKLSGNAIKGCTAEIKKPDPETEEDAKALSEAFFSQLGPNSNFGSQFAQTVMVKCSDAPS
jgi:ABC-type uncharacterized transport system substrate-binding protein